MIDFTGLGVTSAKIFNSLSDPMAWLGGIILGGISYLIHPGATFYALWITVFLDIFSRWYAIGCQEGGLIKAWKSHAINSSKLWAGTAPKVVAYFCFVILANIAQYAVLHPAGAGVYLGDVFYTVMFLVEVKSIAENFGDAGVEAMAWVHRLSDKKLKEVCNSDGGDSSDGSASSEEI